MLAAGAAIAALYLTHDVVAAQAQLPMPEVGIYNSPELFDQVIFWSMAAADSGRAAGKTARAVDTESEREATAAEPRLRAQDGATTAALADCVRRVPALDK